MALIAWGELCKSKEDGGLGFKLLKTFHEALLGKQLSKFLDQPASLWAKVIRHKQDTTKCLGAAIKSCIVTGLEGNCRWVIGHRFNSLMIHG